MQCQYCQAEETHPAALVSSTRLLTHFKCGTQVSNDIGREEWVQSQACHRREAFAGLQERLAQSKAELDQPADDACERCGHPNSDCLCCGYCHGLGGPGERYDPNDPKGMPTRCSWCEGTGRKDKSQNPTHVIYPKSFTSSDMQESTGEFEAAIEITPKEPWPKPPFDVPAELVSLTRLNTDRPCPLCGCKTRLPNSSRHWACGTTSTGPFIYPGENCKDDQIRQMKALISKAEKLLFQIVCTEGVDRGLVLLDHESPTHKEVIDGRVVQVYDHEHFSELGDALINLYQILKGEKRE